MAEFVCYLVLYRFVDNQNQAMLRSSVISSETYQVKI
jgi:hypothetical protein